MKPKLTKLVDYDAKMKLPAGMTCGDCAHFLRCNMLFGCPALNTQCDFYPSFFRPQRELQPPPPASAAVGGSS